MGREGETEFVEYKDANGKGTSRGAELYKLQFRSTFHWGVISTEINLIETVDHI